MLRSGRHNRRKVFDNKHDARSVCHELRSICPRNAAVINIEDAQDDLVPEGGPPMFSPLREGGRQDAGLLVHYSLVCS